MTNPATGSTFIYFLLLVTHPRPAKMKRQKSRQISVLEGGTDNHLITGAIGGAQVPVIIATKLTGI